MNVKAREFHQGGHYLLMGLYSFVPDSAVDYAVIKQLSLSPDERLVGMYLNAPDHFVVFTSQSFHWIRKDRELVCAYNTIEHVKLPANEQDINDEREIEIALKDGDFLFLPVIGDTEGCLDIYRVAQFLEEATTAYENLQALGDLIAKLRAAVDDYKIQPHNWKQPLPVEYFETIIEYLENCLNDFLNGQAPASDRKYDRVSLDQPQTWRLMAEVLLAPKTYAVDKDENDGEN
jgi:hypothetical protein